MFTQARAAITGLIVLVLLILATLIYWRGSSNATTRGSLTQAREVITEHRETAKIERKIDTIVNLETQQTDTQAQEADREIQSLRHSVEPRKDAPVVVHLQPTHETGGSHPLRAADACDASCARILQLAAEARAAAVASSARLQPARTSAR